MVTRLAVHTGADSIALAAVFPGVDPGVRDPARRDAALAGRRLARRRPPAAEAMP